MQIAMRNIIPYFTFRFSFSKNVFLKNKLPCRNYTAVCLIPFSQNKISKTTTLPTFMWNYNSCPFTEFCGPRTLAPKRLQLTPPLRGAFSNFSHNLWRYAITTLAPVRGLCGPRTLAPERLQLTPLCEGHDVKLLEMSLSSNYNSCPSTRDIRDFRAAI